MEKKSFREWRKERGYTTKYVADKLGITVPTLTAKERGKYDFTVLQKKILCDLYGVESIKQVV